jgi:hypothetical protein
MFLLMSEVVIAFAHTPWGHERHARGCGAAVGAGKSAGSAERSFPRADQRRAGV